MYSDQERQSSRFAAGSRLVPVSHLSLTMVSGLVEIRSAVKFELAA